ncbi:hypothetical protein BJV74DRAFT_865000 [Russula compacta]|nr:hypothetical protein BJV74DRAFT_865000 [Russula compacta]
MRNGKARRKGQSCALFRRPMCAFCAEYPIKGCLEYLNGHTIHFEERPQGYSPIPSTIASLQNFGKARDVRWAQFEPGPASNVDPCRRGAAVLKKVDGISELWLAAAKWDLLRIQVFTTIRTP